MFTDGREESIQITLYTDAFIVRGAVTTRHHRVSDILNMAPEQFIVLSDVYIEEWGSRATPVRADYAQVNLASVLFAVADAPVESTPELRLMKIPEQAFISVPPFKVVGIIHLPPEQDMRLALGGFVGRFLPVTDATYWSDTVGEAKASALMVAVNHSRAQILAPHTDVDPWAGLDRSPAGARDPRATALSAAPAETSAPGGWDPVPQPAPGPFPPDPVWPVPSPGSVSEPPPAGVGRGFVPSGQPSRTGLLGRVRSPVGTNDSIYDAFGRPHPEPADGEGLGDDADRDSSPPSGDPWRGSSR